MSVYTGPQGKGAARAHRARKHAEAAARDAALPAASPRRRQIRLAIDRLEQGLGGDR